MTDQPPRESQGPTSESMAPALIQHHQRVWGAARVILVAAVLYFVLHALVRRFSAVSWGQVQFSPYFLAAALVSALLMRLVGMAAYRFLIASFCGRLGWQQVSAIAWIPAMAKYVPGRFAGVVGALWLLRRCGVSAAVAAGVVVARTALVVLSGFMVAAPLTLWEPMRERLPLAWLLYGATLGSSIVCLHPRCFGAVANLLLRRLGRERLAAVPRLRDYGVPLFLTLCRRMLAGVELWFVARAIAQVPLQVAPMLASAAALAHTAGLLAFFAPAGIGVREGVYLLVLGPLLGPSPAALVAVLARLVDVCGDLIAGGAGLLALRHSPQGLTPP
ncbi:MAG: hypothetical protein AMK73_01690 [Planctomycetes bacterium SM23_32]|nr:MAG: hypothetical protein AMK73_01690 [Planctomycetes bacterium SM23_32]